MHCSELTEITADSIDDPSLYRLFVSTQMNNLDLCVKSALQWESYFKCLFEGLTISRKILFSDVALLKDVFYDVLNCFPHFWVSIKIFWGKGWELIQGKFIKKVCYFHNEHMTLLMVKNYAIECEHTLSFVVNFWLTIILWWTGCVWYFTLNIQKWWATSY